MTPKDNKLPNPHSNQSTLRMMIVFYTNLFQCVILMFLRFILEISLQVAYLSLINYIMCKSPCFGILLQI